MNRDVEKEIDAEDRAGPASQAPLWLTLALVTVLMAAFFAVPTFEAWVVQAWGVLSSGERERISDWIAQYGVWGPIVLIVAMTLQMFLLIVPSVLLMAVAVIAFGAWWGGVLAVTAVLAASAVGYSLGAMLGARAVNRLLGRERVARVQWFVDRYGAWTVIVVRLSPFFSNDAISFVAGVLRMNALKFALATVAGVAPLAAAIAFVGSHTQHMAELFGWVSGMSLMILVGFIWLDRQRKAGN